MSTCIGTTRKGNPCKIAALPGQDYCGNHLPADAIPMPDDYDETEDLPLVEEETTYEIFFNLIYAHFCDAMEDELNWDQFFAHASTLGLVKEVTYNPDVHEQVTNAEPGDQVVIKA